MGREGELREIVKSFKTSNTLLLVNGVGGIGKSTIAKEFLNANLSFFDYKIWINYKNSLSSSIVNDLNINFGFKGEEVEIYRKIIYELNNLNGNNLMIIDNFDSPQESDKREVKELLPNFKILITSRDVIYDIKEIRVEELSEDEAIELFKKHYKKEFCEDELKKSLLQIGYHSLLIELIAKALQSSYSNNLTTIQERFEKKELAKIKTKVNLKSKKALIVEHVRELFNLESLSNSQILILKRFAILPSVEIEFNDLIEMFGVKEFEEFENELQELIEKGWINEINGSFKMHQLIIEFMNFENRATFEEVKEVVEYFINKLYEAGNTNPIKGFNYTSFAKNILEVIKEEKERIATLANNVSTIYQDLGDLKNALKFAKKTNEIFEKILDKNNLNLATSYSNLSTIYKDLGDLENAIEFAKKSLEIKEKILDKNHPSLATSYNNLSLIYQALGNLKSALEFAKKTNEIFEKVLNKNHPNLASSYDNLSLIYKDLGDLKSAIEFAKKSLEIREKVLDKNHPSLATSYNNFSLIYQALGDLKNALEFAKKANETYKKILDKNHPFLATSYNNLSLIYKDLGDLENAIEFAKKSLEIREKVLNKNHPSLAQSYNNLSLIHQDLGDLKNALEFAKKTLQINNKIFNKNHPSLAILYNNLSLIYIDLKKYDKAKEYIIQAIQILEYNFPNGHPNLEVMRGNLRFIESEAKQ